MTFVIAKMHFIYYFNKDIFFIYFYIVLKKNSLSIFRHLTKVKRGSDCSQYPVKFSFNLKFRVARFF